MQGPPEFLVTPLLMGPVCLLSQGRFEKKQSALVRITSMAGFCELVGYRHTVLYSSSLRSPETRRSYCKQLVGGMDYDSLFETVLAFSYFSS